MPILNLSRGKKEENKEEVPDELPSLPSEEAPAEEKKEGATEEKKEEEAAEEKKGPEAATAEENKPEMAPDELPPPKKEEGEGQKPASIPQPPVMPNLGQSSSSGQEQSGAIVQPLQAAKEQVRPNVLDERLYFSKLIQKLNEGMDISDIEKEIKDGDIIHALSKNAEHNKKAEDKSFTEKEIKIMISELQKFEKEWSTLRIEIEEKKAKFHEIEKKIREYTDRIKKKFSEIEEFKKHF